MRVFAVVGDAQVADAALFLQLPQEAQVALPVDQVVHLQQVDLVDAQVGQRAPPLCLRRGAGLGRDLGRQEHALPGVGRAQQVAGHCLGAAIAGRGVDDRAFGAQQHCHDFGQRLALGGFAADVEGVGRAHANDGQGLGGAGDVAAHGDGNGGGAGG
ncbi:hypothetical protein D9M72_508160 [compost metagenome]